MMIPLVWTISRTIQRFSFLTMALPLCVFVLDVALLRQEALAKDVEFLFPQPGALIQGGNPETHLIVRYPGAVGHATTVVMKSDKYIKPVVSEEGEKGSILHFRLPLENGKNSFTLIPSNQVLELTFEQIRADLPLKTKDSGITEFHVDDTLPKSCQECHDLEISDDVNLLATTQNTSCVSCHVNLFVNNPWRHTTTHNQQCLKCHIQSSQPLDIGFPSGKSREVCFLCHTSKRAWLSKKTVHGVIELGGCTLCHDPHADKYRYQLWQEGTIHLCLACHGNMQNLVSQRDRLPYVHNIIFGQGCTGCHDPHATDNPFMLIKPINELCLGCHQRANQFAFNHPLPRHPVSASQEHRRHDRELTCSSCHDPHGSSEPYMLIETVRDGRICRKCHAR